MKNTIPNEIPNGGYLKSLVLQSCWSMENNQLKMRWLLTFIFSARGWRWTAFQLAVAIPRCNRRSVIGMWSFKDTPEIHLIMPLSAVTNCWASSVIIRHVLPPHKSTFLHTFVDIPATFLSKIGLGLLHGLYLLESSSHLK